MKGKGKKKKKKRERERDKDPWRDNAGRRRLLLLINTVV